MSGIISLIQNNFENILNLYQYHFSSSKQELFKRGHLPELSPGSRISKRQFFRSQGCPNPAYIEEARALILQECQDGSYPAALFDNVNRELDTETMFFPATKDFSYLSKHSLAEQIEALKFEFTLARKRMERELAKCDKLEDKGLKILFGGYYKKEGQLRQQWDTVMKDSQRLDIECEVYRALESQEKKSISVRMVEMQEALGRQEQKEDQLQGRYAELKAEKERLEKMVASLRRR